MLKVNNIFRVLLITPFFYWGYAIFLGDLGPEPAKELTLQTGFTALVYFFSLFWIGALKSLLNTWPPKLKFLVQERRWMGVVLFLILSCHLSLYLVLEGFELNAFLQIFSKTYLTFGFLSFLLVLVLAATSNNFSVKALTGKKWKQLHRMTYVAGAFATVHIFLIEKADLLLFAAITAPLWLAQLIRLTQFLIQNKAKELNS